MAAESPEVRSVLKNPQFDPGVKAQILADLAGDSEPLFTNFLRVAAEKGRAGEIEEIAAEFEQAHGGRGEAPHRRADDGARAERRRGERDPEEIEKAAGRKVDATRTVDPDLVGGIVLKAGSLRVDASVRGRLERLRTRTREEIEELKR